MVGSSLACKYQTRAEVNGSNKHSSLLRKCNKCGRKKFYSTVYQIYSQLQRLGQRETYKLFQNQKRSSLTAEKSFVRSLQTGRDLPKKFSSSSPFADCHKKLLSQDKKCGLHAIKNFSLTTLQPQDVNIGLECESFSHKNTLAYL